MKKEKFIVYSEFYYPCGNSTSYYMTKIIEAVAKVWDGAVRIFCAIDLGDNPELLSQKNVHTVRFAEGKLSKNALFSRVLKFFLITVKFGFSALFSVKSGDTVFTVTNPAFMLVFLAMLRKIRRFKYILLVYDIFPETLVAAGLTSPQALKYRLSLKIFNWAYRCVDQFIVIGRDMQDVVVQKTGRTDNIVLISNWCDTAEFTLQARDDNHFVHEYN